MNGLGTTKKNIAMFSSLSLQAETLSAVSDCAVSVCAPSVSEASVCSVMVLADETVHLVLVVYIAGGGT